VAAARHRRRRCRRCRRRGGGGPPVSGGVDSRLAALSPEQRALFEKLREQKRQTTRRLEPPPIPRVSGATGEGGWPLSLDQERFWFMEQLFANQAGLNITAATRMRGPLSAPQMGAALAGVVRRHAAWRTTFPLVTPASGTAAARPVQRVAPPAAAAAAVRLGVVDLTALPAAMRSGEAARITDLDTAAPFDLVTGPPLRAHPARPH